jgi:hypothetical protein
MTYPISFLSPEARIVAPGVTHARVLDHPVRGEITDVTWPNGLGEALDRLGPNDGTAIGACLLDCQHATVFDKNDAPDPGMAYSRSRSATAVHVPAAPLRVADRRPVPLDRDRTHGRKGRQPRGRHYKGRRGGRDESGFPLEPAHHLLATMKALRHSKAGDARKDGMTT